MKFRHIPLVHALATVLVLTLAGCGGGNDAAPAAASASVTAASVCPAQTLNWTASSNTCSGAGVETASGSSIVVKNTATGLSGTASFTCTNGAWLAPADAACATVAQPATPTPTPTPTPDTKQ